MKNTLLSFNCLIVITLLNSSTVMSQKYETQEYQVVDQIGNAEIRFYPSAAMIKVSSGVNRNNNFGKLFRYISGNNSNSEKIAMTTPVYIYDNNKTMEFVLPSKYLSQDLPSLDQLENYDPDLVTRIYSADGEILDELFLEKRIFVDLDQIPNNMKNATIASEDRRFYNHWGIDSRSIVFPPNET